MLVLLMLLVRRKGSPDLRKVALRELAFDARQSTLACHGIQLEELVDELLVVAVPVSDVLRNPLVYLGPLRWWLLRLLLLLLLLLRRGGLTRCLPRGLLVARF